MVSEDPEKKDIPSLASVRHEPGGGFFQARNPEVYADEPEAHISYLLLHSKLLPPPEPPPGVGTTKAVCFRQVSGVAVWAGLSRAVFWSQLDSRRCLQSATGGWAWLVPGASAGMVTSRPPQPLVPRRLAWAWGLAGSQQVDIPGLGMSGPQACRLPFPRHSSA